MISTDGSTDRPTDGKAPGAMRTIGEVCDALGLKPHVLRYWEEQFPALSPLKRSGGRRLYRTEDVALVARIDRLVNREGYTLKGARQAIEAGEGEKSASPVPDTVIGDLRAIRERLAAALAA